MAPAQIADLIAGSVVIAIVLATAVVFAIAESPRPTRRRRKR